MLSKKSYTILIILVILFTCGVFYFGFTYEKKYFTLIVDPNFKVKYDGKKWTKITENLSKLENNFDVYDESGYLGKYDLSYLKKRNRWLVYDNEMHEINKDGDIVAFKSKLKSTYYDIKGNDIGFNDKLIIDEVLKNEKTNLTSDNAYNLKYEIDLNGDGKNDKLLISNLFTSDNDNADAYALAVAVVNDKKNILYLKSKKKDIYYTVPAIKLDAIFDVENDGKKEVIMTTSTFGDAEVCVSITKILKKDFELIVQC